MHRIVGYLYQNGWRETSESGNELRGHCPFAYLHKKGEDRNPSFSINSHTGHFCCKACGSGGKTLVTMRTLFERRDYEDIKKEYEKMDYKDKGLQIYSEIQAIFNQIWDKKFDNNSAALAIREEITAELKIRGFHARDIEMFGIAWTGKHLLKHLSKIGYSNIDINYSKMFVNNFYFAQERMSVPIKSFGKIIGFSMRTLKEVTPDNRKYLNIYNPVLTHANTWFANFNGQKKVVLTEGIFDMMKVCKAGFNGIATLGTCVNETRVSLLNKCEEIILIMDNDIAGIRATKDFITNAISCGIPTWKIFVTSLPEGKDPCDCTTEELKSLIESKKICWQWLCETFAAFVTPERFLKGMELLKSLTLNIKDEYEQKIVRQMLFNYVKKYCTVVEQVSGYDIPKQMYFQELDLEEGNYTQDIGNA